MWIATIKQSGLRCQLCALEADRLTVGERVLRTRVVAHVDQEVLVLAGPTAWDVLVAPRRHLVTLSTTPEAAGRALSSMRIVADIMSSALGVAGATLAPTLKIGGGDHVSFRVVPTVSGAHVDAPPRDVDAMVTLVSCALTSAQPTAHFG